MKIKYLKIYAYFKNSIKIEKIKNSKNEKLNIEILFFIQFSEKTIKLKVL